MADFWSTSKLGRLVDPCCRQLTLANRIALAKMDGSLVPVLGQLGAVAMEREDILKSINTALLFHARADDLAVRVVAFHALKALWEAVGDPMVGLVAETIPTLVEQDAREVNAAAQALIQVIEARLGESLASYLS